MHFPIENHTNFLCVSGSHAFGTATETSDVDLQGFCSIPRCTALSFIKSFEQNDEHYPLEKYPFAKELLAWVEKHNVKINPEEPLDQCIFSLKKFFKLTADANPNLHTLAFADDDSVVFMDDVGEQVRKNRDLFLSARVRYTYSGYAVAQLRRIETHRKWLLNPVSHDPTRMEFGLPEKPLISKDQLDAATALVDKYVKTWLCAEANLDVEIISTIQNTLTEFFAAYMHNQDIVADAENVAMNQLGFSSDFINVLRKEKAYRKAKNEWKQYQEWQKNRNPARAEMEKKFGFDGKHAGHLVRLMRMCKEILITGRVLVKRPDAEELLAIRNGAWTYEQVITFAKDMEAEIEQIYRDNEYVVPNKPNVEALDELFIGLQLQSLSY